MADKQADLVATALAVGLTIGLLVAGFATMLANIATNEAWDDDICAHDEIRARIEYRIPPEDSEQITRCIALEDYEALDRDGQIIHPDGD